jgi:hypothetical protein
MEEGGRERMTVGRYLDYNQSMVHSHKCGCLLTKSLATLDSPFTVPHSNSIGLVLIYLVDFPLPAFPLSIFFFSNCFVLCQKWRTSFITVGRKRGHNKVRIVV